MKHDGYVVSLITRGKCNGIGRGEIQNVFALSVFVFTRVSCVYIILQVSRHFHQHINKSDKDEIWFEYAGEPLRWHYPIGVLFDLHGVQDKLPWKITVHFKEFPEEILIRCSYIFVLKYFFFCT